MKEDECCDQPADGSTCCEKPAVATLPLVSCCSNASTDLHGELADLLSRYNVNDYAASVRVYAFKPS